MESMSYDEIVDDYAATKRTAIKRFCEEFTFLDVLGDVRSVSALDLGCGDGHYTRALKRRGGSRVVGVDLSEAMVASARAIEARDPLGIEYRVGDVTALGRIGSFDVATAVFLFPHAATEQALTAICQSISDNLKPGGRLVGVMMNPDPRTYLKGIADMRRYDRRHEVEEPLRDGSKVTVTITTPRGHVRIQNHYWQQETCERVFRRTGFEEIAWHPLRVSPEGMRELGGEYWRDYLVHPTTTVVECRKE